MLLRISLLLGLVFSTASCGEEIGDSCTLSTDCSTTGERICDTNSPGGYCTIIGCDVGTCPDEAVCVRFFPVTTTNRSCELDGDCTSDEVCTFRKTCAPRNSEIRFCMKNCGSNGDCRDDYECRDESLMIAHGGEPVPEAGEATGSSTEKSFCAAAPLLEN